MRTKKMVLNTIFSLTEEAVAIICAFILPRLILSHFGSTYNGLITSITQFLACAVLLRSGIGGATRAALYKPLATKDKDKINAIVKATDLFMKRIGMIMLALMIGFSIVYSLFVVKEFDWIFTFTLFLIIGISTFAESFFGITYLIILQADQSLWISAIIKSICYILNVVIASILILSGFGIHIVKLGSALAFCIYPIVLNIYIRKRYKIKLKGVTPDNSAIAQRWDAFWHQVAVFVNSNTDVMVLTLFSTMLEVSVYSIYGLVISGLRRFIIAVTNGIEGAFGDMLAKEENDNLKETLSIIELMVNTISTIVYSVAIVVILHFITIYTKGITDVDYLRPWFAYILLFSGFVFAIRLPYQFIIRAAGKFKDTKKYAIIEVIVNIAISVVLVIKFGLIGVSIGTIVATLYKTIMYANYISKNIIHRSNFVIIKKFLISCVEMSLIIFLMRIINIPIKVNYMSWVINGTLSVVVASIITGLGIAVFYRKDFKNMLMRFKNLKRRKVKA